ncbi:MAG TPA: phosphate uptake regulator PhoU [Cerasibacillus sp.]|uniref:phosphate uptake regulator PhoU n=1 Tax=Cerasibacillus sp. TaxID=2498711 RepID=UPI002F3F6507
MLKRQSYHKMMRTQMKVAVLDILNHILKMTSDYLAYLAKPSDDKKALLLDQEKYIDQSEQKINDMILELITLQPLTKDDVKELFGIGRIAGQLERVGDQLINLLTISEGEDVEVLKPVVESFFKYEYDMMEWLLKGIKNEDAELLKKVIRYDEHVNKLNIGTYESLVHSVEEHQEITGSNLKTIIAGRFLERLGDYLVTIAKTFIDILENK